MSVSSILSIILGAMCLVTGLSVLNKKHFTVVIGDLVNNKAVLWLAGFITFVLGVTILSLYHVWSTNWRVVITVIGWLSVIKGFAILVFPHQTMSLYEKVKNGSLILVSGVIAIIVGALLLYAGVVTA